MALIAPQELFVADSLSMGAEADSLVTTSAAATHSLDKLFGGGAHLVEQAVVEAPNIVPLTDNWMVSLLLICTFVYYGFILWAYGGNVIHMAKVVMGGNAGTRVVDEVSYLFMRAVRNLQAVGILAWSLVAIKWIEMLGGEHPLLEQSLWLVPMAVVVALALGLVQRLATAGILNLVGRRQMGQSIGIVASTTMALAATVATPFALLFVLNTGETQIIIGWGCLALAGLGLLVACTKSLIFFIEQKISILLWFLYLCTAILIPIGVIARLVAGGGII